MMTLTSGEWEVEYGCYSHEHPYETRTLLPVISSGSSSGSGPVSAMGWSFQDEQFLFGLEDAPLDGTLSLRVLRNSGTLAVSWAIETTTSITIGATVARRRRSRRRRTRLERLFG